MTNLASHLEPFPPCLATCADKTHEFDNNTIIERRFYTNESKKEDKKGYKSIPLDAYALSTQNSKSLPLP